MNQPNINHDESIDLDYQDGDHWDDIIYFPIVKAWPDGFQILYPETRVHLSVHGAREIIRRILEIRPTILTDE